MARRGYVQLVNGFYDNDKVRDLVRMGRADSVGVYCMALSLCGDRLTDGFVPRRAMLSNIGATPEQVRALVDEGMLEEVDEGWIIHDYTVHNRTKEQVLHARADAKERKNKSRCHSTVTSMSQRDIAVTSGQTPEHQNTKERERRIFFFFLQRNRGKRLRASEGESARQRRHHPKLSEPRPIGRMERIQLTALRRNTHRQRLDATMERLVPTQSQHERHPTLETTYAHMGVRTHTETPRPRITRRRARHDLSAANGERTQQGRPEWKNLNSPNNKKQPSEKQSATSSETTRRGC